MKRIASIFLSLCVLNSAHAQNHLPAYFAEPSSLNTMNAANAPEIKEKYQFAKKVALGDWAGHAFRYEMAVRSESNDSISGLQFFGAATDKNSNMLPDKFVTIEKRYEQEWTIFTIVGTLPKNTDYVWFFTSVTTSGTYYFDDISLFLENTPGSWKQQGVENASFEDNSNDRFAGYAVMNTGSGNPHTALSDKIFKTGKQSLMITYQEERQFKNVMAGE